MMVTLLSRIGPLLTIALLTSVKNRIPDYLKDLQRRTSKRWLKRRQPLPEFQRLWSIFPEATGLQLRITELDPESQLVFPWSGSSTVSYRVEIEPTKRARLASLSVAHEFEEALSQLINALAESRAFLRHREAELAAAIPVVSVETDGQHLADRLEAVLRGTAEMIDCQGAGLYLLDEGTTSLKLRAHFGLANDAFLKPPRGLEEAMADVEALAGHAVVIEDVKPSHWSVPEPSQSAICVPVGSATAILGTVWMFCDQIRDFTPNDQNLVEIAAGRLAADLERAVLTQEVRSLRSSSGNQIADEKCSGDEEKPETDELEAIDLSPRGYGNEEAEWNGGRIAHSAPYVDGWDVAEIRTRPDHVGDFCHWHIVDDDRIHLGVGAAHGLTDKRLSSVAFEATHSAHTAHNPRVREAFERCNQSLWTSSVEGDASSLFHGVLNPVAGSLSYGLAGAIFGWILRPHGWEPLLSSKGILGIDCDLDLKVHRQMLMPGDILLVMSAPQAERSFEQENRLNQIPEELLRYTHLPAIEMAEKAARELRTMTRPDQSLAVSVARRDEL